MNVLSPILYLDIGKGDLGVDASDSAVVGEEVLEVEVVDATGEAGDAKATNGLGALLLPGHLAGLHRLHDVLQEVRAGQTARTLVPYLRIK